MKTIQKTQFTTDKYLIIDEKSQTVMELETGHIYIAMPNDEPETTVCLFEPAEWFDKSEKLADALAQDETFKKMRKELENTQGDNDADSFPF